MTFGCVDHEHLDLVSCDDNDLCICICIRDFDIYILILPVGIPILIYFESIFKNLIVGS